mgnify:CR=1 FL=1
MPAGRGSDCIGRSRLRLTGESAGATDGPSIAWRERPASGEKDGARICSSCRRKVSFGAQTGTWRPGRSPSIRGGGSKRAARLSPLRSRSLLPNRRCKRAGLLQQQRSRAIPPCRKRRRDDRIASRLLDSNRMSSSARSEASFTANSRLQWESGAVIRTRNRARRPSEAVPLASAAQSSSPGKPTPDEPASDGDRGATEILLETFISRRLPATRRPRAQVQGKTRRALIRTACRAPAGS